MLHALFLHLDAVLAPIPGLNKHNYGVSSTAFCVSAGLTEYFKGHAAAALDAALRLQEEACNIRLPDGSSVALSIGIASGPLGDGLIGSPGNMQYQLVGRPVAVAQRLAICGEAGCIRIASNTWQLLRCSDAGTNVKSSSWHPSFKLLMGASDIVTCYSYQPGLVSREFYSTKHSATAAMKGTAMKGTAVKGTAAPWQGAHLSYTSARAVGATSYICAAPTVTAQRTAVPVQRQKSHFQVWFVAQQAQRDAAVAALYIALALDHCMRDISLRAAVGQSMLVPVLTLVPSLLLCSGVMFLQAFLPQTYIQQRRALAALMRYWQIMQLVITTMPGQALASLRIDAAAVSTDAQSRVLRLLPHLTAALACVVSAWSSQTQYMGLSLAVAVLILNRITGRYWWLLTGFTTVCMGIVQGGLLGEQLLAGCACGIAMLRTGVSLGLSVPLALVSTLVPFLVVYVQENRARTAFLAAGSPELGMLQQMRHQQRRIAMKCKLYSSA